MSTQTLTEKTPKQAKNMKKTITIDGNNFSDLNGFYTELESAMHKNIDWEVSRNLYALNDLLGGGFGVNDFKEPFTLVWKNSLKSKMDLDFPATIKYMADTKPSNSDLQLEIMPKAEPLFVILVNIIKTHPHIELVLA
jgi:RNAse (barnase) inhibitor barstar